MTQIVAFTGKRGAGKDSAAQALKDIGYTHMSFADPLREVVQIVYGISMEEMMNPVAKENPLTYYPFKSPREILTLLGTQGFRDLIADDTWVKAFERRAREYPRVVNSDLRFLNEEAMLKENGACIIRIVNPHRVDTDAHSQHRSETEMDGIEPHFTLTNDGTIGRLHSKVLSAVSLFINDVA